MQVVDSQGAKWVEFESHGRIIKKSNKTNNMNYLQDR
jgi:hypothetical protein